MSLHPELGATIRPSHPDLKHTTMTPDPELGAVVCPYNPQASSLRRVLQRIAYFIVAYSTFSIAITTLVVSFLRIVSWIEPHTARRWLSDGRWGVVIWGSCGVNTVMFLVMEMLDIMLDG